MTDSSQPAAGAWAKLSPTEGPAPAPRDPDDEKAQKKPAVKSSAAFAAPSGLPGLTTSSSTTITWVHAPVKILYGSLAASVTGLGLAALATTLVLGALSWSLSALVGLGLAGFFLLKNADRQAQAFYADRPSTTVLYRASIALALLAIAAAAVRIAFIVGRM